MHTLLNKASVVYCLHIKTFNVATFDTQKDFMSGMVLQHNVFECLELWGSAEMFGNQSGYNAFEMRLQAAVAGNVLR
jgi:hypothetical protein